MSATVGPRRGRAVIISFLLLVIITAGCASSGLKEVHQIYETEYSRQLAGTIEISGKKPPKLVSSETQFPETLNAIVGFRAKNPTKKNAVKHVAVLEAMIYLQSGQYGMARLAAVQANKLEGSLTTVDGAPLRDELFLKALILDPGLVDAWEIIRNLDPGDETLELATLQRIHDGTLEQTARGLSELANSAKVAKEDDGALYIAATAAICYLYVREYKVARITGVDVNTIKARKAELSKEYGKKIRVTMEGHLTEVEKMANEKELEELSKFWGRYQFVRLYHIGKAYEQGGTR